MLEPEPQIPEDESEQAGAGPSLPHSTEAEQSVLGGLMQDATHFDAVAEILSENDFYKAAHRKVYRRMVNLVDREMPILFLVSGVVLTFS